MAGLMAAARDKGVSGYLDDGTNRWAAIHHDHTGRIVRLALDNKVPPGTVLHATAETGIPPRDIAEAIGRGLGLPVVSVPADRVGEHFGWLTRFYNADMAASSDATRAVLGWTPDGPSLVADLDSGGCYH
jgi:nucleoside-diphosphate-sugar epimerase